MVGVCCSETVSLLKRGLTIAFSQRQAPAPSVEPPTSPKTSETRRVLDLPIQAIRTYLHLAGIRSGYGFFAPNVPPSYTLVFEVHYPDGRSETESAGFAGKETNLRFASLMDYIGRTGSDVVREGLVKQLVVSLWQQHPDAVSIRAILGSVRSVAPAEHLASSGEDYDFICAYDFVRTDIDRAVTAQ